MSSGFVSLFTSKNILSTTTTNEDVNNSSLKAINGLKSLSSTLTQQIPSTSSSSLSTTTNNSSSKPVVSVQYYVDTYLPSFSGLGKFSVHRRESPTEKKTDKSQTNPKRRSEQLGAKEIKNDLDVCDKSKSALGLLASFPFGLNPLLVQQRKRTIDTEKVTAVDATIHKKDSSKDFEEEKGLASDSLTNSKDSLQKSNCLKQKANKQDSPTMKDFWSFSEKLPVPVRTTEMGTCNSTETQQIENYDYEDERDSVFRSQRAIPNETPISVFNPNFTEFDLCSSGARDASLHQVWNNNKGDTTSCSSDVSSNSTSPSHQYFNFPPTNTAAINRMRQSFGVHPNGGQTEVQSPVKTEKKEKKLRLWQRLFTKESRRISPTAKLKQGLSQDFRNIPQRDRSMSDSTLFSSSNSSDSSIDVTLEELSSELDLEDLIPQFTEGVFVKIVLRQDHVGAVVEGEIKLEIIQLKESEIKEPILILSGTQGPSAPKRALIIDSSRVASTDPSSLSFLRGSVGNGDSEQTIINLLNGEEKFFVTLPVENAPYGALVFLLNSRDEVNNIVNMVALLQTFSDIREGGSLNVIREYVQKAASAVTSSK